MRKILIVWVVLLWALQIAAKVQFPDYGGFVNDFAKTLGDASALKQRLAEYDRESGNQVVVVTIETSDPLTPQQYAEELFDAWRPGQKGKDNGVIILNAVNERRVVIRTGYGLEDNLPDARVGRILDESVIPHFKEGNPLLGLYSGAEAVIATITPGMERPVPEIIPAAKMDAAADAVPCEDNPDVPQRAVPHQYIQDFEKGSNDDSLLQKIRDESKVEVVIVGVKFIPKGISGRRFAECIAQNWQLGASLHRKGKGMAIVADAAAGIAHVGLGSRLKDSFHASTISDVIRQQSEEKFKPLAISDSLSIIAYLIDHMVDPDWEDITLYTTLGFVGLGLVILVWYLIFIFFRALFTVCPKCRHRFPKLLKRVETREATTRQTGIEHRCYRCRHCGDEWIKVVTLAMLSETRSRRVSSGSDYSGGSSGGSGSGGFGGGSSGGGGADRGY